MGGGEGAGRMRGGNARGRGWVLYKCCNTAIPPAELKANYRQTKGILKAKEKHCQAGGYRQEKQAKARSALQSSQGSKAKSGLGERETQALVVLVYQDSRGRSSSGGAQHDWVNISPQNCSGIGAPDGRAQKLKLL